MAAGRAELNGQWERGHHVDEEPTEPGGIDDDRDVVGLPPAPICAACFHAPCPCCPLPWCDQLLPGCCEHTCEIDRADFELWKAACDLVFPDPDDGDDWEPGPAFTVSEGPWFPAAVRRERGVL